MTPDGQRPGHHRVLHQGWCGQVGARHLPGGGAGPARSNEPVCLVDADLQFGDVAVMLKLTPHHTIVDAVSVLDRMDAAAARQPAGDPRALRPAGACPRRSSRPSPTRSVRRRWWPSSRCCGRSARFVIVDTPAYFNDVVLGPGRGVRRGAAGRRHGHPEHQEREDRPADPAAAQHADGQAAAGAEPGQQQGEARRRRGRADAPGQGRHPDPERRLRPPGGQQGRTGGPARAQVGRDQVDPAARRPVPARRNQAKKRKSRE